MGNFNRKDRLKIAKKIGPGHGKSSNRKVNWRQKHLADKRLKEEEFNSNSACTSEQPKGDLPNTHQHTNKAWYTLAIAIPGSILNNVKKTVLKTYVSGEIARNCAIFCVDEVIIFDETAQMTQNQLNDYLSGMWAGEETSAQNDIDCNFFLAKILEFMECPQYLRKSLFQYQKALLLSGVLNPMCAINHLRFDELDIPYREGVVIDKPIKEGRGSWCDVGLEKKLQLTDGQVLPTNTRVTIKITSNDNSDTKNLKGRLTSARAIRRESGLYWGYNVRIAKRLSDVFAKKYDVIIGTSEKGQPLNEMSIGFKENCSILVVFGGLGGLESAMESDDTITEKDPAKYFTKYLNSLPDQGSRVIRTEEAIPITLSALKYRLNAMSK